MSDDKPGPAGSGGRRKDGKPFREGNTREDGSYEVGRNRTPAGTRFQANDGRPRGRRPKGVCNADTAFEKELNRKVRVKEDGKERKVPKSLAVDLRLLNNAYGLGENKAIEMVDTRRRRIAAEKDGTARRYHTQSDQQILEAYLRQRAAELNIPPGLFGDPAPEPASEEGEADG